MFFRLNMLNLEMARLWGAFLRTPGLNLLFLNLVFFATETVKFVEQKVEIGIPCSD